MGTGATGDILVLVQKLVEVEHKQDTEPVITLHQLMVEKLVLEHQRTGEFVTLTHAEVIKIKKLYSR